MAYSLKWMPEALRKAGLKVEEVPGWQSRGHGDMGTIRGVMCHHTADGLKGNYPSLGVVEHGRPGLGGPLAQLGLARDGKWLVIAAGKCWHAGAGRWQGQKNGNTNFIGVEAENTGYVKGPTAEPWSKTQYESYAVGVAALCDYLKLGTWMVCGHKEYALPPGRKTDPTFDMTLFRATVNQHRTPTTKGYTTRRTKLSTRARAKALAIADAREFRHPWEMIQIMLKAGYSEPQAFGWTGNAQQESYEELKTDVWGDAHQAHGIFQWHTNRWVELEKFARAKRVSEYALATQVLFSLQEPGERVALKMLKEAESIEAAVDAGLRYLRPGWPNRPRRIALALALAQHWPEMKLKLEAKRGPHAHWGC